SSSIHRAHAHFLSFLHDALPILVALGATAAQSVFGKITPVTKNRGHVVDLPEGPNMIATKAMVTVHPSYLLRLPDADAKAREYRSEEHTSELQSHLKLVCLLLPG